VILVRHAGRAQAQFASATTAERSSILQRRASPGGALLDTGRCHSMAILISHSAAALTLALVFVGGLFAQPSAQVLTSASEERYSDLHRFERETQSLCESEQRSAIAREYDRVFTSSKSADVLKNASAEDLAARLKAASLAGFYSHDRVHLVDMQRVFSELERRDAITREQVQDMLHALLAQREFDEARKLSVRLQEMHEVSVPEVNASGADPTQFNAYAVEDHADVLAAVNVDISKGAYLIVVSHPLCAFSRNAQRDLAEDSGFAWALSSKPIWLAPVSGRLNLESIRQWNRERPGSQILLASERTSWPVIENWATPQFYAVRDGVVIGALSGWPKEGRKVELAAMLRELEAAGKDDAGDDAIE